MINEEQKEREEKLEIFIPNGPRLGRKVIEAHGVRKAFGDKLLYEGLDFMLPPNGIVITVPFPLNLCCAAAYAPRIVEKGLKNIFLTSFGSIPETR